MHEFNSGVANLQSAAASNVCTATRSLLTGLGGIGSFSPAIAFVLIFEMGQKRANFKAMIREQVAVWLQAAPSVLAQPRS